MLNPLKTDLTQLTGLTRDALHVHLGLLAFLVVMLLLRRGPASVWPWLCVLGLELANEVLDVLHWHGGRFTFSAAGAAKDVVNTMLWPTVILLLARFAPRMAAWRR